MNVFRGISSDHEIKNCTRYGAYVNFENIFNDNMRNYNLF